MEHLHTFESFSELNEATKGNPSNVKEGDLIRWTPRRGNSYFKRALYGKCTQVYGSEAPGEYQGVFIGWSDASKQQPEYAYPDEKGSFSGKKDTEVPFSKVDIKKELDIIENTVSSNFPISPMALYGVSAYLKDVTIWKP